MEEIEINNDVDAHYFAMEDFELSLKLANTNVELIYVSEPPHGDSYHHLFINEKKFPGYVWGCHFLFPYHQKYMICSWMEDLYDRKTVIINIKTLEYKILKKYYYQLKFTSGKVEMKSDTETSVLDSTQIEKMFS